MRGWRREAAHHMMGPPMPRKPSRATSAAAPRRNGPKSQSGQVSAISQLLEQIMQRPEQPSVIDLQTKRLRLLEKLKANALRDAQNKLRE
jgi:hypothetical protein